MAKKLDTQNIRDILYTKKITLRKIAKGIGISESNFGHKLAGDSKFNHIEIFGILKILDMPFEQVFKLK